MTCNIESLTRMVVLSTVLVLLTPPVATAQAPASAPPAGTPTQPVLLSAPAFARLVQKRRLDADSIPVAPRNSLIREAMRAAPPLSAMQPQNSAIQQRSWISRHKVLAGVIIGVGAFSGILVATYVGLTIRD